MIAEYISNSTLTEWVLCLIIFLLVLWKLWPDVSSRISNAFNKARYGADLMDMVEEHERALNGENGIQDKLQRDYDRINKLEVRAKVNTEENELIMESMLAILKSINKIEPSEDAEQVQEKIIKFMNEQSHRD